MGMIGLHQPLGLQDVAVGSGLSVSEFKVNRQLTEKEHSRKDRQTDARSGFLTLWLLLSLLLRLLCPLPPSSARLRSAPGSYVCECTSPPP